MKKLVILLSASILFSCSGAGDYQNKQAKELAAAGWKTLEIDNYSIQYPDDWDPDQSKQLGTNFFIFSRLKGDSDAFKENVNLVIQDLGAQNIDLDKYTKISEDQIKMIITNSELIESKRMERDGKPYQKMVYSGDQGQYRLQYEQFYFIKDSKAYILTFTAEEKQFKDYAEVAEKILQSFNID